jgi:Fic family protein
MDRRSERKAILDDLRPLSNEQIRELWPRFEAEKPQFVQSTNAIEGNRLTLGETIVVLQEGITIGGKTVREHVEVLNGGRAFDLMLSMAQERRPITASTVLALHEAIMSGEAHAGAYRDHQVYIFGGEHVPPNHAKVRERMDEAFATYEGDLHPIRWPTATAGQRASSTIYI